MGEEGRRESGVGRKGGMHVSVCALCPDCLHFKSMVSSSKEAPRRKVLPEGGLSSRVVVSGSELVDKWRSSQVLSEELGISLQR